MLAAVRTAASISAVPTLGNMKGVAKSAPVSVLAPSTIVDNIKLAHEVFPFVLHIPTRRHHPCLHSRHSLERLIGNVVQLQESGDKALITARINLLPAPSSKACTVF
jgi:hypothetical protein